MIKKVEFPEYTNAGINAALVADKLNEVIMFLRDKFPEPNTQALKPEVKITKNGKYYIPGKGFIKKEDAYV